jgi:replication initiation and membrane attachment protein
MKNSLLQADIYTVINQSVLTEVDKQVLISLYEPIIGSTAVSLFLTLWQDLEKGELISRDLNHNHLMVTLKKPLNEIEISRHALETVGLLKTYLKKTDNNNEYLYELYSPLSAYEFFNHPVLTTILLNNVGEIEYKYLNEYYKKIVINKKDYEEITSTMNETFKSVTPYEKENEDIRKRTKNNINIAESIDFDFIIESLPKGLINEKTFNKKVKELINQLAFVYNVDTMKMSDLIRMSISDIGLIDKEKLIQVVRKNYEFNTNGALPTIVYRTQPEHLRSPKGDTSDLGKMITVFESTKPYDFLRCKNKGAKPSQRELKILELLAINYELPPGVINVLIDYAIRVNDGKLNQNYLEAIASTWKRKGIKTVPDAIEVLKKNYKKQEMPKTKTTSRVKEMIVPDWMNKEIKSEAMTEEELRELEKEMEMFK